ncbi:type II secretion system protein [Pantoea cypripedii]|jgi:general secretion pathway protein G|uniref:General secretion pathway protein GspG n=1 Tax=Pantoea cypripedii TaxID=55209 RepID=A0A6B9G5C1_PANCY|nr:type II secretion system protein [Pantoea cypripedii]QGY32258.1 general secretion pathway protein GspG [Pantoea cypripedii]
MQRQRGFTLIEMMVTLALLGTLAAAATPLVQRYHQQRQEEELRDALREIRTAIDLYKQATAEERIEKKSDASGYPPSLNILVEGVKDKQSPKGSKIYFLRRIPRDPMCDCDGRKDEETWRLRAADQPPGEFTGGKDVYDISSSSRANGLNGVPYAQW